VSEACALAMARGMRRAANTDLALAVTGIAGPDGGTPEKPVGTVFLALAAAEEEKVHGYRFAGSRAQIRQIAAHMGLEWLRRFAVSRLAHP
jgi:nicotinamide-nucleotide amidase